MLWVVIALYACTVLVALGVFCAHPKSEVETSLLLALLWPAVLLIGFGIFIVQTVDKKKTKISS